MRAAIRWLVVALAIGGVVTAIVVSRHTPAATIDAAAGVSPPPVAAPSAAPADPPVLDAGPAPSVEAAAGWLNTAGLTDADLAGRVVLYDFWTFGCVNCRNTLPHVKAWQERYAGDGLTILSIHTPEFAYEADPANVAEFVADNGLVYPVALDPERDIWRTWDNHYWPAFYLYDQQGRLRLHHAGEGSYDTTEDAIRSLLGVDPASPRAAVG